MCRKLFVVLIALLAFSLQLDAVKAWPYPVQVQQPDGSVLTILLHGDENRSWKTTPDGRPVYQDAQGWWRVTDSLPPVTPLLKKQLNPEGGLLPLFLATKASVNIRTIVIPVQFQDRKFTIPSPRNTIYNLFNQQYYSENGATGSVLDWFRDNLGSGSTFSFEVCDVVTLPLNEAWYGANADGVTDRNIKQMVQHACQAADAAGVDFTRYDFDGDGVVDNVFLFFAGHNEAEGGGDNTLWPQSWNISDLGLWLDGMKISNFSLYSEYTGPSGYQFAGIGTICHEYCHFLGLPDLYDVNDDEEGAGPGLYGSLSIMDRGNYNNDGRTPPYLTIFERQIIGLVRTTTLRNEQALLVPPVQQATQAYVLPTGNSGEDFWLEYRDGAKWDAAIGGTGLVVYQIDKSNNMAGSMSARMRWTANAVNGSAAHPCARFVPSTGTEAMGVEDAFYPGKKNVRTIHSAYLFPLLAWSGKGVGLGVTDITRTSDGISCQLVFDNSWDLPVLTGYSIVPGQTSAQLSWESDKRGSGQWNLRWGAVNGISSQTVAVGSKNQYVFEDLLPGETYYCELYYSQWNVTGRVYRLEFQALNRLSDYPLIGAMDRSWHKGEQIRLFLLNLTDEKAVVSWAVDSQPVNDEVYTFSHSGDHKISATIVYSDGARETLTKILEVKE
jgi:M6 family metalloprotease-like protein